MHVRYDAEVDILYIRLSDAAVADSESVEPNLVLDRDAEDNVVGIEVLWASRLSGANPLAMAFEVAKPPSAGAGAAAAAE